MIYIYWESRNLYLRYQMQIILCLYLVDNVKNKLIKIQDCYILIIPYSLSFLTMIEYSVINHFYFTVINGKLSFCSLFTQLKNFGSQSHVRKNGNIQAYAIYIMNDSLSLIYLSNKFRKMATNRFTIFKICHIDVL